MCGRPHRMMGRLRCDPASMNSARNDIIRPRPQMRPDAHESLDLLGRERDAANGKVDECVDWVDREANSELLVVQKRVERDANHVSRHDSGSSLARTRIAIPGTKRRRFLEENVAALSVVLSVADLQRLDDVRPLRPKCRPFTVRAPAESAPPASAIIVKTREGGRSALGPTRLPCHRWRQRCPPGR